MKLCFILYLTFCQSDPFLNNIFFSLSSSSEYKSSFMTNKMLVLDIQNNYPFGQNHQKNEPHNQILVRKVVSFASQPRFIVKQKIKVLRILGSQHLVGLHSVTEEQNCMYLMFEYVGTGLGTVKGRFLVRQMELLKTQLVELAEKLVNLSISIKFKIGNIGLDDQNNLKYFLGLDFKIDRGIGRTEALRRHRSEIQELLKVVNQEVIVQRKSVQEEGNNLLLIPGRMGEQVFLRGDSGKPLMKKSSTEAERSTECEINKNQEHRLTFDINSQKRVQENGGECMGELRSNEIKLVKMQELGERISKLKNYMKEVTGKATTVRVTTLKADQNLADNCKTHERKFWVTPGFNKLEKKIAQFRESRMLQSYKQKQMQCNGNKQGYEGQIARNKLTNDRPLKEIKQRRSNHEGTFRKQDRSMSPVQNYQPLTPPSDSGRAHWNFNSYGLHEDERKTKQYKKLAQTDKYCEEFMYFLEDDQPVTNQRHKSTKTVHVEEIRYKVGKGMNQNVSPQSRMKGFLQNMEHMTTQSSEKGALQLQARVKNVIRHSIKLINNLKGKQLVSTE